MPLTLRAQLTAPSTTGSLPSSTSADKTLMPPSAADGAMFSSAVDPAEYHVGPGDVLQVRFWTSDQSYYPMISSDEVLIVNRIGEFPTHGKTLSQLRDEVYQKAATAFESFIKSHAATGDHPITLSLYQPRRVYVKVRGDVTAPGGFVLGASTRADVAVDLANKELLPSSTPQDPNVLMRIKNERDQQQRVESMFGKREIAPASQRYVTITHSDGSMERLDLVRFNTTHDPKSSPLLREGDVIDVPYRDLTAGVVGVYGAVRSPGEFEFVENDSLSSALKYAFGPTAQADLEHVEVTSNVSGGNPITKIYNLRAILSGTASDVTLLRGDRVVVRGKREHAHAAVVAVHGEVEQPGAFPIEEGVTKLTDVIKQAGGLTPRAYPRASRVLRHGHAGLTQAGTYDDVQRTSRLANMTVEDTASFERQMSLRQTDIVVDLDRVLTKGDKSADISLADGDEIIIGERPTTIYVSGFVNNSGYVPYEDGAPLNYYIARAGGYANGAVQSETVIFKAGSKAWMDPSDTRIEPGDEIYVPKKPDIPVDVKRNEITSYANLGLSIATFGLTLYTIFFRKQ